MDHSFKANFHSLSERVNELETENHQLKSENRKLKNEVQLFKKQLKSYEKQYEDKLNTLLTELESDSNRAGKQEKPDNQQQTGTEEPAFTIPDNIVTSNRFSVLGEGPTKSNHNTPTPVLSNSPLADDNLTETTYLPKPETTGNQKTETAGNQKLKENSRTPASGTSHNIVLLIDSNGKFIDTSKFNPRDETCKIFCPTIPSVMKTLSEFDLGKPSHIVIHVGTNDIEHNSVDSCHTLFKGMIQLAATKYPTSKILISSLVVRDDNKEPARTELNSKLGSLCLPYPNIQLVNNEGIPKAYLHDNKHLKRRNIGVLVANLKDAMYNRIRPIKPKPGNPTDNSYKRNPTPTAHYSSPNMNIAATNQLPIKPTTPPQAQNPTMFDKKTYAQVTKMADTCPMMPTQPAAQSPYVDMHTVMGLLRLYESMRYP